MVSVKTIQFKNILTFWNFDQEGAWLSLITIFKKILFKSILRPIFFTETRRQRKSL